MIPFTYSQWLGVRKNNPGVNNVAAIKKFISTYVTPEVNAVKATSAKMTDVEERTWREDIVALEGMLVELGVRGISLADATAQVDALVAKVNAMRAVTKEGALVDDKLRVARYDSTEVAGRGWKSAEHAVEGMDAMVATTAIAEVKKPAGKGAPDIPVVSWSVFKAHAPLSLIRLIRDIRNTHRAGVVLDTRTTAQSKVKADNPKQPASLRSWHMNDQGALPIRTGIPAPPPAPAPAPAVSPLHAHLKTTATGPFNNAAAKSPIGYAEYTGTGIVGDMHNSKIVLDYISGAVYLTVTHYQRWNRKAGKYTIGDKERGEFSAWFYIDFTT